MSRTRRIVLIAFILATALGAWARYAHQKNEQRKREALFRQLSLNTPRPSAYEASAVAPAEPAPAPEPRDMHDSTLPQELLELVRQAVGRDFKLVEVRFGDSLATVQLSADGSTVQQYMVDKTRKKAEGPSPVQIIGGGKLSDSLFDAKLLDLALVPKLAREGVERAGLPEGKADAVSFAYPGIRYAGEGPEWTVYVASRQGEKTESKFVIFDARGKFKRMF